MQRQNIEGLTVMLHAILSAIIIVGYIVVKLLGHDDQTLAYAVIAVLSYWFGFTAKSGIFGKSDTSSATKDETIK